jgi:hypothetical protein
VCFLTHAHPHTNKQHNTLATNKHLHSHTDMLFSCLVAEEDAEILHEYSTLTSTIEVCPFEPAGVAVRLTETTLLSGLIILVSLISSLILILLVSRVSLLPSVYLCLSVSLCLY